MDREEKDVTTEMKRSLKRQALQALKDNDLVLLDVVLVSLGFHNLRGRVTINEGVQKLHTKTHDARHYTLVPHTSAEHHDLVAFISELDL